MKKFLILCFVAFGMNAQTTQSINSQLKLNTVPVGSVTDSLLVRGNDKIVKKMAVSNLVGDFINDGATTIAPSQNAVFDALGNKVSKTGNETMK